jgi:hypothetical protein
MAGKLTLLIGLGAGYVFGARSGRERYDQIAAKAQELWSDPRVQEKTGRAVQVVKDKVASGSDGSIAPTSGPSATPSAPTGGQVP